MANVYARKGVTIVRGKGARLYDQQGNEYLDLAGGYGTCIVGHAHPKVVKAISDQAGRLISCHGSTYNDARAGLLERIAKIAPSHLTKTFLSNSGTESIECAIKLARKFTGRKEIVCMMGAFHGKTYGSLSATWDKKYREGFEPLVPEFTHIPYGNVDRAAEAITTKTAAVLFEPIQGEGGIRLSPDGYLNEIARLCIENDALLVADEIQTGLGRTGKMFAVQHWNLKPDILCFAKGVASGLPIGVTLAREDIMQSLRTGEHTTTYGGNPVVCAAASATIDVLLEERLTQNAAEVGDHFLNKLNELRSQFQVVRDVRGIGLMLALESRFDVYEVLTKALEQRVLLLDAGRNVIRFLPPLVLSTEDVDAAITVLKKLLQREELGRLSARTAQ